VFGFVGLSMSNDCVKKEYSKEDDDSHGNG